MILFHGSPQVVREPRILIPNRTLDYGTGFYTTTSEKQAYDWALRRVSGEQCGYVNIFEFDEVVAAELKRLDFANPPGEEWVDFVYANRNQRGFTHDNDLVYGPVANDRVYAAFALYEQGLLSKQELIAELKTYKLIDQMVFHTEEALQCLTFMEAKEVKL
ncbi:MAG: DUF3990 domain-containing protein [Bacteroidales bacterium]|nr:DUF3990 domain-containing protein [Bacteroidales bacterium]